jgi:hypothetical protein
MIRETKHHGILMESGLVSPQMFKISFGIVGGRRGHPVFSISTPTSKLNYGRLVIISQPDKSLQPFPLNANETGDQSVLCKLILVSSFFS